MQLLLPLFAPTLKLSCVATHKIEGEGGVRSGDLGGQFCEPWRPSHPPGKRWSGYILIARLKWGGAPSCRKCIRNHLSKGTSPNTSDTSYFRNCREISHVLRPSKINGPISWLWSITQHTFTLNGSWNVPCIILTTDVSYECCWYGRMATWNYGDLRPNHSLI
jgi:hypothetical protein